MSHKNILTNFVIFASLILLGYVPSICGTNESFQSIVEFGPVEVRKYEDVGSQEVIYLKIPSAYSSHFILEWSSLVAEVGSGFSQPCPDATANVLLQQWSIPLPNPDSASAPPNTLFHDDLVKAEFVISQSAPNASFIMEIKDNMSASDVDYYVSIFLSSEEEEEFKLLGNSKSCVYLTQLAVKSPIPIPIVTAHIDSPTLVDSLNSSEISANYQLDKSRLGLFNTVFKTEIGGYNVTRNSHVRFSWIMDPFYDVGGTLKMRLGVKLHENQTLGNAALRACVMWVPNFTLTHDNCRSGENLTIDIPSNSSDVVFDLWHWPFPRSGLWVMDVFVDCGDVDCSSDVKDTIFLNANVIQCIDSCHSDKYQGDCKLYRTNVVFFTACDCKGGWAGVACTDGTNAVPYDKQLLIILLLTLSNIIFIPCGVLAAMKGYYTESLIYFFVMFFSTFYHACDEPYSIFLCIMKYDTLQFTDFLGSVSAMWITCIMLADLPCRLENWFHVAGLLAISVAVAYNRFSVFTTLIPVLCGLIIMAFRWGGMCKKKHTCYPDKKTWLLSIVPGGVSAIIGFSLFAFVETSDNYYYVHSLWHIFIGIAILFLIPKTKKISHQINPSPPDSETSSLNCYNVNHAMMLETDLSDDSA